MSFPDCYAHCEAVLREGDKDRWLACMFAPADKRPHLHALYAFNLEVSRIAAQVTQPLLGEMRLQFWTDLLGGGSAGDVRNPVADALLATLDACRLHREPLLELLEARLFDLYNEPHPDLDAFDHYCDLTCGALFRLAGQIVDPSATGLAAAPAGRAYALTGLLRALPWLAAEHKSLVPADIAARHGVRAMQNAPALRAALEALRAHARENLAQTRAALERTPAQERPAYRPLALPKLYLAQMDEAGDPLHPLPEIPQWRRQWALLRAKV
ncbi:phytoene/squalene synthase family protein [Rhodoblastus acidophilus]|uniref:Phytoene/squalene synthase family protein n=1 Tax=Rhodoblastus acidophilus TaxID=1074 RepID=A0A6N8DIT9_RHOAC|nr:squalene/phytoene synthase family protein [Rhodoblastus acidophilus]MCW2273481.1 phytoene synthase [Rhodoblastus acidophilus]MTV30432.1 phytoene/squalene synthase family protein [Rhodoblastus acidophilus]